MPSGLTRKYAPADINFAAATATRSQAASGFAKGSFVEVDRYEDAAKTDVGSDGEVTLIISSNQSGYLKLTLQQSSPFHDFLTACFQALQQRNLTEGVFSGTLKDNNGNTLVSAKQFWVKKPAKITFSDGSENWEWTLDTGYLNTAPGSQAVIGA